MRPRPGHIAIKIGVALARFSGGVLSLVLRRVNCAPGAQVEVVQYSICYFVRPEDDIVYLLLVGGDIMDRIP